MPTYRKCSAEVGQIVESMLEKYHHPLRDANVNIECLFAYAMTDDNGDKVGSALKLGGYACNAIVRVLNLKDRTVGRGDAEIVIDGDQWDTWGDDEKAALIDHEIEHLELKTDRNGLVVRDDLDRPKLRMRKHDHQFGWFDSIARRHGAASFEVQQYSRFQEAHHQRWLPGFEDDRGFAAADNAKSSGGIDTVTFSTARQSVTLTSKDMKKVAAAAKKLKSDEKFGNRSSRKAASSK